jgi:hypothetical protein
MPAVPTSARGYEETIYRGVISGRFQVLTGHPDYHNITLARTHPHQNSTHNDPNQIIGFWAV